MEGWERLVAWHRAQGSLFAEVLRPGRTAHELDAAEKHLGFPLDPQVRDLYAMTDGVDLAAVARQHGVIARLVPGVDFPGLAESLAWYDDFLAVQTADEEPGPPWQDSWFPVFPLGGGEAVVVDCAPGAGTLRHMLWVEWEAPEVGASLDEWLNLAVDRLEAVPMELYKGLVPRPLDPEIGESYFVRGRRPD